jgi:polyisoprenoid-binding protein YceI
LRETSRSSQELRDPVLESRGCRVAPQMQIRSLSIMPRHGDISGEGTRESPRRVPAPDVERWEIDPTRSSLRFVLRHIVVSEIRGQFRRWGGTLFFNPQQPLMSSLEVWVDAATIDTDSVERDEHIRSSELLDVGKYPRAQFESTSVELQHGHVLVRGRLALHGVVHDLDVEIEPFAAPPHPDQTYRVTAKLDRQNFGLHWNQDLDIGGVVVADEIAVQGELRLVRRNGEPKPGGNKNRA